MNKVLWIILVVLLVVLVLAIAVYITYTQTASYYLAILNGQGDGTAVSRKADEILTYIDRYYIDEYSEDELADAAAEAIVTATGDPWSYYLTADEYDTYMETMMNAYVGIGVTITLDEEGGGVRIESVTPNSPAYEAGIQVGDIVTHVEGQSTLELDISGTQQVVRGEEGTSVHMTFLRDGTVFELDVVRASIETIVAECLLLDNNIGYVTIYNFDERCASETLACVEQMLSEGAEALIFDVRFNGGGLKDEMVEILDYLLPEGDLFLSVDYAGREEVDRSDAKCLDIPMAVLVNQDSYSAAEFFAAAIQEYNAGTVVGSKTTGKGKFQTAFTLSDGSLLNLSIGKYYTPSGVSLSDTGITPDIELDLNDEEYAMLYYGMLELEDDDQLQAAIEAVLAP